jgi:ubiquitin-conjugating enzyme E2 Z
MSSQLSSDNNQKFVSKQTLFRLAKDVKDIINNPLTSDGIFYSHDSENFLVGRAMIIGPQDTPYEGLPMLFKYEFPHSYPHDPPKATFCTSDGITRFHPNYYKCGKVCLSILNTWSGEKWSGCQTITSILLTMISIMTDNPFIHEPGMDGNSSSAKLYKNIIEYSSKKKINDFIENGFPKEFEAFYNEYKNYLLKNKQRLIQNFESKEEIFKLMNGVSHNCPTYNFTIKMDYQKINKNFQLLIEKLE